VSSTSWRVFQTARPFRSRSPNSPTTSSAKSRTPEALRKNPAIDLKRRVSKKERDELEALMDVRDPALSGPMQGSITRVHGFLTSVISGPMIVPSEWIPVIFGDPDKTAWETMDQARRAMGLIMRFYNEISSDLASGGRYSILIDRIGDRPDTLDLADDWCRGYALGIAMREDEWKEPMEAAELQEAFIPILALAHPEKTGFDPLKNPEKYEELVDVLPNCAVEIYEWWRKKLVASMQAQATSGQMSAGTVRRAAAKISPNAPCPCGSGKKYKRCCSALRAV
jgi:uncharacterized protein